MISFATPLFRIKAGEVGGTFTQVFRGHVLEGSIRIEDHTVDVAGGSRGEYRDRRAALPALEGGAWNLIYELRDHQSQYTRLAAGLEIPTETIRTVRSTPYFEIYTVEAGPVHIIPEREPGSTNHGVDYWQQPTTGSRLVDRTRDHTFSSATTGYLRLRRPRVDTENMSRLMPRSFVWPRNGLTTPSSCTPSAAISRRPLIGPAAHLGTVKYDARNA